jgi:hypothetical protein
MSDLPDVRARQGPEGPFLLAGVTNDVREGSKHTRGTVPSVLHGLIGHEVTESGDVEKTVLHVGPANGESLFVVQRGPVGGDEQGSELPHVVHLIHDASVEELHRARAEPERNRAVLSLGSGLDCGDVDEHLVSPSLGVTEVYQV